MNHSSRGTWNAHIRAWKWGLDNDCDNLLVFEDDAFLSLDSKTDRGLESALGFVLTSGRPFDVLLLGYDTDEEMYRSFGASAHKMATDIRLLANLKEVEEPFGKKQIGSSAMAYKRNPMRCERATGLSRFVISLWQNGVDTAATQWLERTLDDSSNRRMSLPESFLALDNALDIMGNVTDGIVVNQAIVKANLARELPFMATEDLMLAAARAGADRQEAHEVIRTVSREVAAELAQGAQHNDLLERLSKEPLFAKVPLSEFEDASRFVGRAPEQVDGFVREVVDPIRAKYRSSFPQKAELSV